MGQLRIAAVCVANTTKLGETNRPGYTDENKGRES